MSTTTVNSNFEDAYQAVIIDAVPNDIAINNNPIVFDLSVNDINGGVGVQQAFTVIAPVVSDASTLSGSTFTITTPEETLTYYFSTNPQGNEIPIIYTGLSQLVTNMANFLESQPDINYAYDVQVVGLTIRIVAREVGSRFNISSSAQLSGSVLTTDYPSQSVNILEFYLPASLWIKPYIGTYPNGTLLPTLTKNWNKDNLYRFDLQSILQPYAQKFIPTLANNTFSVIQNLVNYWIKYGCNYMQFSFNQMLSYQEGVSYGYQLWAGTRDKIFNTQTNSDYTSGTRKLLSNQPEYKNTFNGATETISFIGWYNGGKYATQNITFDIEYLNGSTGSFTKPHSATNFTDVSIYTFTTQSIINQAGGNVKAFTVSLPQFESQTYRIVQAPQFYGEFIFENKLGGYDTCRLESPNEIGLEKTFATYEQLDNDDRLIHETVYKVDYSKKYSFQSGWISSDEYEWLNELILSKSVYKVIDLSLYKIIITAYEWQYDSLDKKYRLKIEYKHDIIEQWH